MFLDKDEHIIVMEDTPNFIFNLDDLHKIENAGIKTVLLPRALYIDRPIDDTGINFVLNNSNLKVLMLFFYSNSHQRDLTYYIKRSDEIDKYLKETLKHFEPIRDRVQLVFAIPEGGEFLWDCMLTEKFPVSDQEVAKFFIGRLKIMKEWHEEIWITIHNFMGHHNGWNNVHLPYLYSVLAEEFDGVPIYSLQFIHYSCGGTPTTKEQQMKVKQYKDEYGIKFFVGSNHCEGIIKNFSTLFEQEFYGFLTAPMHSENPNQQDHMKEWMVTTLRGANGSINDYYSLQS